ncbi:MAG: quinolinate synthase A [Phycisphaerae bacterium]|nr:MAG: quinolinate synthase A [Phycisphaerae bacterium]
MLWQPSLPDSYTRMTPEALAEAITARRRELGDALVILGHHYQTDGVIRHADHTGDSLKLSQVAAGLAASRPAGRPLRWIVFCGVHFMAETADMLTPDGVSVILPDLSAGCSMADMAPYDDTVAAWEAIHESLRGRGWRGRVVPITYVNSSAAIKAFVGEHGGACCTSSNAREVFRWARGEAGAEGKILFLPDQHLGRNTAAKEGIDVATGTCVYDPKLARKGEALGGATDEAVHRSEVILWAGHCSVHKLFRPEHCAEVRDRDAREGTRTTILVHPECCKEVVDLADLDGSTEFIIRTIRGAEPGTRWAVGTETHLVSRLAREAAGRGVEVRILSSCQCLCTTMFRIDEPHLLWALDNLAGRFDGRGGGREGVSRVVNEVRVTRAARARALMALERMLSCTGATGARATALVD